MKKKLAGVFFLLVGVMVLVYPSFTSARPNDVTRDRLRATPLAGPNDTTITLTQIRKLGQPTVRTWVASGGVADSGSWFFLSFDDSGSILHSPVVGAAQLTLLLVGQDGSTITLEQNDLLNLEWFIHDPLDSPEAGWWHIVDGTGAYSTLHGAGRYSIEVHRISDARVVTWQLDGHTTFGEP